MSTKFPYLFVPGTNGPIPRSIIPIQLGLYDKPVMYGYRALIDSGADLCMFPAEVATEIGIADVTAGARNSASGIVEDTNAEYYIHSICIKVGEESFMTDVGFMPVSSNHGIWNSWTKRIFRTLCCNVQLKE